MILRTGDMVRHKPTGHILTIAYVDGPRFAAWGSYVGEGFIRDIELVRIVSDDRYHELLAEMSVSGDPRAKRAAEIAARRMAA